MSNKSYSKWLIKSKDNLEKVVEYDLNLIATAKNLQDPSLANMLIGGLYSRYAMAVQDLDHCLDQMIQVQKNFTVRKLTEAAATRLNELKEELIKLDISEYHYIDGALIEMKLIPHDVEILYPTLVVPRVPEYEAFWQKLKNDETIYEPPEGGEEEEEEETKVKKKKKKKAKIDPMALLASASKQAAVVVEEEEEEVVEEQPVEIQEQEEVSRVVSLGLARSSRFYREKKKRPCNRPKVASQLEAEMSQEEKEAREKSARYLASIILIQAHERARQSRLYVHDVLEAQKGPVEVPRDSSQPSRPMDAEEGEDPRTIAACKIQAWWRDYIQKDRARRREIQLRTLIGMVEGSNKSKEAVQKYRKSLFIRRNKRYEAMREYYNEVLSDEKARVLRVVAPGLFEDIGDEIRQWFKDWYYSCKVFKDIPSVEEGGTVLVVRGDIESPEEHYQEMLEKSKNKGIEKPDNKKNDDKDKKAKEEEEKKKKQKKEKGKKGKASQNVELVHTAALDAMQESFEEYNNLWADVNDADNPENKPYMDVITEQMCYEVQMEVRPKVDEVMRLELQFLKNASQKDKKKEGGKGGKGGKGKKGKAKEAKEKKGKKEKGKKGKKAKKDPTGRRKVEDLFQELYDKGIIRKYPETYISDLICDFSYQNYEQREMYHDPPATLGDAQWAVIMNCIFPLGISKLPRPKSILLTGPRGCGLDDLANAVFTETQCVLFDLSPGNLDKFPGKKGNKDLVHLVPKMSKLLQPSIIYVGNCEKAYYKKVPKEEKAGDPKRVGKFLAKIIKAITINDQVQVLGTSYFPFLAQVAKLKKVFQKIILVPRSDYGSIYIFLQDTLMRYHGVDRNFNISAIATLTKYYPLPEIKQAIETVLNPSRIIQLHYKPLEAIELIIALQEGPGPVTDKEWEKYEKFYAGTKLGKARKAMNAKNAKIVENLKKKEQMKKMQKI